MRIERWNQKIYENCKYVYKYLYLNHLHKIINQEPTFMKLQVKNKKISWIKIKIYVWLKTSFEMPWKCSCVDKIVVKLFTMILLTIGFCTEAISLSLLCTNHALVRLAIITEKKMNKFAYKNKIYQISLHSLTMHGYLIW